MTGTSAISRMFPISSMPSVPGSIRSSRTRVGVVRLHLAERLLRVAGHNRLVTRPGERVPDVPERLRVVVHHEDALPLRPLPAGGEPGNAGCGIPGHRNREGEPRPQARPVALGPNPAPVGLHYPLADGEAQPLPPGLPLQLRGLQRAGHSSNWASEATPIPAPTATPVPVVTIPLLLR